MNREQIRAKIENLIGREVEDFEQLGLRDRQISSATLENLVRAYKSLDEVGENAQTSFETMMRLLNRPAVLPEEAKGD